MELNRVLIVDDDPAIRRVVSALLDLDEYGLLEAADGQAALEVVKVERPDLVILDLTMPRLDGLRACQALRSDPELAADEQLRYGFLLHDVGKVGIPEAVLNKPGPLDADEWEVMRATRCSGSRWWPASSRSAAPSR